MHTINIRIPIAITILLMIGYLLSTLSIPPVMFFSDPGCGFLIWKSMLEGAPFNHMYYPCPDNIQNTCSDFITWWTPGQYLIPGLLSKTLSISLGRSLTYTIFLFSISGLLGFAQLFKFLKFSPQDIAISVVVIASQRFFSLPFTFYNGGEILLWGVMPWIILAFIKYRNIDFRGSIILLLLSLAGFISKSSFLVLFTALSGFMLIESAYDLHKDKLNINNYNIKFLLRYLAFASVFIGIILNFVLLKGANPAIGREWGFEWKDLIYPISAPLASAFSIDDLIQRIFFFPGSTIDLNSTIIYGALAIASGWFIYKILKTNNWLGSQYNRLLLVVTFLYISIFIFFYVNNSNISYEMRHLRVTGVLLIPGIVKLSRENKNSILKYGLSSFLWVMCVYGTLSFVQRKAYIKKNYPIGKMEFCHFYLDQPTLNMLHKIDGITDKNSVVYITHPELALEFNNARFISSSADFDSIQAIRNRSYKGYSGPIYLVLPKELIDNGKAAAIKESFLDYKSFETVSSTDRFEILIGQ